MNDALLPDPALMAQRGERAGDSEVDNQACPACETARSGTAKYCSECGRSLREPRSNQTPEPVSESQQPRHDGGPTGHVDTTDTDARKEVPSQGADSRVADAERKATEQTACACGRALHADARFCQHCGRGVTEKGPQYWLRRKGSSPSGTQRTVIGEQLTIGAASECGITVPDDGFISHQHVRVFRSNGNLVVEDLGSSNGTWKRVRQPVIVHPGDEFIVGKSVFCIEGGTSESTSERIAR